MASLLAAALGATNPNLKYFSVWHVGSRSVSEPGPGINSSFLNFFFDVNSTATLARLPAQGYGGSLLHVREVLFWPRDHSTHGLRPDYKARWAATLADLKPLLASGAAMGIFLGDELLWDCVPYADLVTAANLVRADLDREKPGPSRRAIIYWNEAFPPLDDAKMWAAQCGSAATFPSVPDAVDWVSIDYYPNEGTFKGARRIYETQLYPRMAAHQRVTFVPPAFGCVTDSAAFADRFCCADNTRDGANPPCNGDCEAAMVEWAHATYDWAREDERFVGINPWHWMQRGVPPPSSWPANTSDEPGLYWLPKTRQLYEAIGREIVSGRQGDVRGA